MNVISPEIKLVLAHFIGSYITPRGTENNLADFSKRTPTPLKWEDAISWRFGVIQFPRSQHFKKVFVQHFLERNNILVSTDNVSRYLNNFPHYFLIGKSAKRSDLKRRFVFICWRFRELSTLESFSSEIEYFNIYLFLIEKKKWFLPVF